MRSKAPTAGRRIAASGALVAGLTVLAGGPARAQSLTVLPVNLELAPGQLASTLTVINNGDAETSIQVRALAWDQPGGAEHLAPSDEVLASPPIATIAPGATQVVRLILTRPPQGKEKSFRLLVDQIPPAAAPGTVRLALRLSIPVFAAPPTRAVSHVQYHVGTDAGRVYLIAVNNGARHDTIRDLVLTAADGTVLKTSVEASPYILAGATRRWMVTSSTAAVTPGQTMHLTARSSAGPIDQPVPVLAQQ